MPTPRVPILPLACLLAVIVGPALIALSLVGRPPRRPNQPTPADSKPTLAERLPRLAPKEPADALGTFHTLDGFRLELVAAEPQVNDPVAAAYDEDGRLYVIEMRDYPEPLKPGATPLGRVRLLEDRDGDGVYETAHVFAEELPWPTGVACWDGGVYVTAAPDIWYLKDTNGDGAADVRRKVYKGFVVYNVQALVNGLQWGVDNHIWGVTAGNGGEVRPADGPDAPAVSVRGRDFRFDPRTGSFEATSGTAQFGNAFDDWYNRYLCANRLVAGHVVLPAHALARNPYLAAGSVVQDCAAEGPGVPLPMFQASAAEPWREVRTKRYHDEGMTLPPSEMVARGLFTSGTGVTIYRGDAYPARYRGNAFVGNVAGNLVHRRTLTPKGATFVATRADAGAEFVASTDNWFRPVNFVNAPDGTLHVLDMYREVVEHPWSIPDDIKAHLHLDSGRDRGRIYRLARSGFKPSPPPRLGSADAATLVATLENANSWWRETAQRLLIQRRDTATVGPLRRLAEEGKSPLARMHALWTLHGLDELTPEDVTHALHDPVAGVREHAVRLAEPRLKTNPTLAAEVRARADDPDARVRFQTALALGELLDTGATRALAAIARRDAADPWARLAVLSASADRAGALLALLVEDNRQPDEGVRALLVQLAAVVGARNRPDEIELTLRLVAGLGAEDVRRELVLGVGDGLVRTGRTFPTLKLSEESPAGKLLADLVQAAVKTAADDSAPLGLRTQAIALLAHAKFDRAREPFRTALDARQPKEVQIAAVKAMRNTAAADVPPILLECWNAYTPEVRAEVVAALSGRAPWAIALLEAVGAGKVPAAHLDPARRNLLLKHRDAKVREKAEQLLGAAARTPRSEVIERYRPALARRSDAVRGREVFRRECASCHVAGGMGQNVGPSIASLGVRTPEAFLLGILDPNREVDPRYLAYNVATTDGRVFNGVIASETATAVTLRRADGATDTVLRSRIEELTSTGQSLMPEGLEQKVSLAEMADLLAFLLEPR